MHPVSILTFAVFFSGYITARWDLVTRLYELAIFAWDHEVITRAAKGFVVLTIFFLLILIPVERIAAHETALVSQPGTFNLEPKAESDDLQHPREDDTGVSAREQLRRRGSF